MARTGQTRSAAANAAVTRRRNRERAEAQTAGTKPAGSQRHAADQAKRVAATWSRARIPRAGRPATPSRKPARP